MAILVYEYKNCSTCQKALKFLDSKKVSYEKRPIVDEPPTISELKKMLSHIENSGESFKKLFNVSGQVYREQKIGDQIKAGMTKDQALKLLSQNGKLIKRPFLLTDKGGAVGFKEDEWKKLI